MTQNKGIFGQDGFTASPKINTAVDRPVVQNGYLPTPTVTTSQTQTPGQGTGGKK